MVDLYTHIIYTYITNRWFSACLCPPQMTEHHHCRVASCRWTDSDVKVNPQDLVPQNRHVPHRPSVFPRIVKISKIRKWVRIYFRTTRVWATGNSCQELRRARPDAWARHLAHMYWKWWFYSALISGRTDGGCPGDCRYCWVTAITLAPAMCPPWNQGRVDQNKRQALD